MMAHRDVSKEGVIHEMSIAEQIREEINPNFVGDERSERLSSLVREFCNGTTNQQEATQDRIRLACDALKKLLIAKNNDYGNQFQKPLALAPNVDPVTALRVRLSDKLARLLNLLDKSGGMVDESIEDTLMDAAGYFLLWKVQREIERLTK